MLEIHQFDRASMSRVLSEVNKTKAIDFAHVVLFAVQC